MAVIHNSFIFIFNATSKVYKQSKNVNFREILPFKILEIRDKKRVNDKRSL
jgi:hypothetical protein